MERASIATPTALVLCAALAPMVAAAEGAGVEPASAARPAIALGAACTGERWAAVGGGVARGGAYLDDFDLTAEIDGERALGVPGLSLYAYVLYDNGHEFAAPFAGAAQGVSNIEAVRAWRLYETWVDWSLGAGSLRVGLYNLNAAFDVNETGALFLNPAHGIGTDYAQSGRNGPSIFPVTPFAVRYRQSLGEWQWQVTALDGVPGDPEDPASSRVRFASGDGVLLAGEVGRALPRGRVAFGAWHSDVQYVANPGTDPALVDAWVVGLRCEAA